MMFKDLLLNIGPEFDRGVPDNPEVQLITPPVIKVRAPIFFGGSGGEIYTVFDEESESEVENLEILHPDLEIKENQTKKR